MTVAQPEVTLEEFDAFDAAAPEGLHVELINGRLLVTPAPDGDHDWNVVCIRRQIEARDLGLCLYQERGLAVPAYRAGRARVDGAVASEEYFRGQPPWADPSGVLLVIEVTSGRDEDAEVDRVEKRDAYAQAGLPVYLLVDRQRGEAVVHWDPEGGRYLHQTNAAFGAKLRLPKPFGYDLDTSKLG
ncbi:Uma2 family endonuclease [Streptomyces sp. B-S-A8]|uniref:Uma2 family endonuclease n=1 Tax=Streptomyces solicavernae TaxID=3043614 RepID=A0ABT6RR63_9ACTN|nr:Uma2 family endonuclease [Streptomyces sp. B-S-A8]MDI3386931.1 Uma2 family endonuclease [Streptomyces sp. B-S-A8]